jgi:hypothetical protein
MRVVGRPQLALQEGIKLKVNIVGLYVLLPIVILRLIFQHDEITCFKICVAVLG